LEGDWEPDTGIKDLSASLKECEEWAEIFEKIHMVYRESNWTCAKTTTSLYLKNILVFMRGEEGCTECCCVSPGGVSTFCGRNYGGIAVGSQLDLVLSCSRMGSPKLLPPPATGSRDQKAEPSEKR
jgi:hypothetical protein